MFYKATIKKVKTKMNSSSIASGPIGIFISSGHAGYQSMFIGKDRTLLFCVPLRVL